MPIKEFLHVKLVVENLDRALEFYLGTLGFRTIVRYDLDDGGVIVQVSPTGRPPGLELWCEPGVEPILDDRLHVALGVTDLLGTVQQLRSKGVALEQEPFRKGHELIAFLRDPDGYLVELNEDTNEMKMGPRS